jgi:hypothetical protein
VVNTAVVNVAGDTQTQNNSASSEAITVAEPPSETDTLVYMPIVLR